MSEMLRRSGSLARWFYAIALCLSLCVGAASVCALLLAPTAALADDDDGGDSDSDDDDDDGGGFGGGGGGSGGFGGGAGPGSAGRGGSDRGNFFDLFRPRTERAPRRARQAPQRRAQPRRTQPRRATRPAPARQQAPAIALPTRAPAEIIALGLTADELAALLSDGYAIIEQSDVAALGATLVRLSVPAGTGLEEAREAVRALNPAAVADFNHFYRPVESRADDCRSLSCGAAGQIAWPVQPGARRQCTAGARIGLIDTGINADHEALAEADLTILPFDLGREAARTSSAQHGTAVAAILLSSNKSRAPGLVPDAKVYAVDAFFRTVAGGVSDERTDAYTLVRAMDRIAQEPITALNLSLAGPQNTTLEAMVETLSREMVIVASAGNAGPRGGPLYPAAYEDVIGVTAVDHNNRVFRRATQGEHVDLAAPGVEVWTAASVRGVKPRTGTSFATPFVTAVVALLQSQDGALGLDDIRVTLAERALDLGTAGRDPVYGDGLVQAPGPCLDPVGAEASTADADASLNPVLIEGARAEELAPREAVGTP